MIRPSAEEVQLRNQIAAMSLGQESPLTFYSNLLEELRTGKRAHANKNEFRDLYEYSFLLASYTNLLLIRIEAINNYVTTLETELRKVNPEAMLPKLTLESAIVIDGRDVSLEDLFKMIAKLANVEKVDG